VVCDTVRRRLETLAAGIWYGYVSLRSSSSCSCAGTFAYSSGRASLAGVAHRLAPGSDASGSPRRFGLSFQSAYATHRAGHSQGALLPDRSPAAFSSLGPHCLSSRVRSPSWSSFCCACSSAALGVCASACRDEAEGLREYGTLAERYVREFDAKWLHAVRRPRSRSWERRYSVLADLANSYEWCGP